MKGKNSGLGIIGVDIIVAVFASVVLIGRLTDSFTIIPRIMMGIGIGLAFAFLIITPYVGVVFQTIMSAIYALFLYMLVPYKDWVDGNVWWIRGISIGLFFLMLYLHRKKINDIASLGDSLNSENT